MEFSRRVFADTDVKISSDIIHLSIVGVRYCLRLKRMNLENHKSKYNRGDFSEYHRRGAVLAIGVRKLEQILKDLNILFMQARIKEITEKQIKRRY